VAALVRCTAHSCQPREQLSHAASLERWWQSRWVCWQYAVRASKDLAPDNHHSEWTCLEGGFRELFGEVPVWAGGKWVGRLGILQESGPGDQGVQQQRYEQMYRQQRQQQQQW